jgi:hypothetical protein
MQREVLTELAKPGRFFSSGVGRAIRIYRVILALQIAQPLFSRILIKCAPQIVLVHFSRHYHGVRRCSGTFVAEPSLSGKIHHKGCYLRETGRASYEGY